LKKAVAIVQIVIILFLVGFSTYQLFQGRLDLSLTVLPLLMAYYVFVTVRNKRKASSEQAGQE
jgi:Ca2+/Na+ antiporter